MSRCTWATSSSTEPNRSSPRSRRSSSSRSGWPYTSRSKSSRCASIRHPIARVGEGRVVADADRGRPLLVGQVRPAGVDAGGRVARFATAAAGWRWRSPARGRDRRRARWCPPARAVGPAAAPRARPRRPRAGRGSATTRPPPRPISSSGAGSTVNPSRSPDSASVSIDPLGAMAVAEVAADDHQPRTELSGQHLLGEQLVLDLRKLARERDHDQLVGAELGDQLCAALRRRQLVRRQLRPQHRHRMRLEGDHAGADSGRARGLHGAFDHAPVAQVHAVEAAQRQRPLLAVGRALQRHLDHAPNTATGRSRSPSESATATSSLAVHEPHRAGRRGRRQRPSVQDVGQLGVVQRALGQVRQRGAQVERPGAVRPLGHLRRGAGGVDRERPHRQPPKLRAVARRLRSPPPGRPRSGARRCPSSTPPRSPPAGRPRATRAPPAAGSRTSRAGGASVSPRRMRA